MKTRIERVDDIPLLVAEMNKSKVAELIDQHFLTHGNWQGLSNGQLAVGFLAYILSCSDHRLSHVEPWVSERLETLRYCMGNKELTSKDFTDDRLGLLLDKLADDDAWMLFETALNQTLINVYNLNVSTEAIRLDAMITQSHRQASGDFQYGHSKQHRSDLPQLKTMVAALDPLAMPLFSYTVSGNTADDVLYLPIIQQCETLGLTNQLFVGDSKMGSIHTRAYLQKQGHCYLTPLGKKQCSPQTIINYLAQQPEQLTMLYNTVMQDGKEVKQLRAKAFELSEKIEIKSEDGIKTSWNERRIVVYSPTYAKTLRNNFEHQIDATKKELAALVQSKQGQPKLTTLEQVQQAVDSLLKKNKVKDFITVTIKEEIHTKTVRAYKDKPAREVSTSTFSLEIELNETKQEQHLQQLGWRVYACNADVSKLSTEQAVTCYRNEYKIEHKFDELLNRITALMPVFLQKEERIKALVRLLLLALKFVSAIQHQVRTQLEATKKTLKGIFPGNPNRKTDKPTTNLMLRVFRNIHLNIVSFAGQTYAAMSDLTPTQLQIINLLNLSPEIYLGINKLSFSDFDFSET